MSRPIQPDGRLHGVVVAVRREDGRWLCIRRSHSVAAPGKVCFPGGAIEIGEAQEVAVVREMLEEVGIQVRPVRRCWRWDSPATPLTLWGWIAEWVDGEIRPEPLEVAEILWLTGREVTEHKDAMPSNRSFVASIEQTEPEA